MQKLDADIAKELLESWKRYGAPDPCGEEKHCWATSRRIFHGQSPGIEDCEKPLLRLWDLNSGSQPAADGTLYAREPRMALRDGYQRKHMLIAHADYQNWKIETPFISFTDSPHDIERLATLREQRPKQMLTVIDPRRRIRLGLPILSAVDEMKHYGVQDPYWKKYKYYQDEYYMDQMRHYGVREPYGKKYSYYQNEYLCLWEVTPEEIVGTWSFDRLSQLDDWYEGFVLPQLSYSRMRWQLEDTMLMVTEDIQAPTQSKATRSTPKQQQNQSNGYDAVEELVDEMPTIWIGGCWVDND